MTVRIGLFDLMRVDPTSDQSHAAVYAERLDDLVYADELGFAVAFTAERHYLRHYRCPAPNLWVAAASLRTKQMRLGVLDYPLPIHDPVRLAEEVAVLDQLSGGRMEVGVGLGHRREELSANGVDPEERIPIFQERLAVLEALWSGARTSLEGRSVTLREVAINPLPVQQPRPPLWYAGVDGSAATWAGTRGMSLAVGFAPLRDLVPAVAGFKGGLLARGEFGQTGEVPPGGGRIALMQHVYVAETDDAAHAEMRADLERLDALNPTSAERTPAERAAAAGAELDRLLANDVYLAGSPETVANGIRFARRALGIDHFLADVWGPGMDQARVQRTLRLLATDVLERVNREPVASELDVATTPLP